MDIADTIAKTIRSRQTDWNDFTPRDFVDYCKEVFEESTWLRAFSVVAEEWLYNISTFLEESISDLDTIFEVKEKEVVVKKYVRVD